MRIARILSTTAALAILAGVGLASASPASAAPPDPAKCNSSTVGRLYTDPATGHVYQCTAMQLANGVYVYFWMRILPPASGANEVGFDSNLAVIGDSGAASGYYSDVFAGTDVQTYMSPNGDPWLELSGWLANDLAIYYWTGSDWITCADSGWYYNPGDNTYKLSLDWHIGNACGNGWYGVYGGDFAWNSPANAWSGAWVWSGYSCFGCGSAKAGGATTISPPRGLPPVPSARRLSSVPRARHKIPAPTGAAAARHLPRVLVRTVKA